MKFLSLRLTILLSLLAAFCVGIQYGPLVGVGVAFLMASPLTMGQSQILGATGPYTLLDLAARSGKGIHTMMEGVLTYAPELMTIPTFPKGGITYSTLTRTELPSGDFRSVGGGVVTRKSVWKKELGSMALFEAQMRVPEDIVIASRSENQELTIEDLLADEAIATVRGSAIKIGSQFWYGLNVSADGFAGLSTQVDTASNEVDAGGSAGADSSTAYLVYMDDNVVNPQGVHFLLGNGGRMSMSDVWGKQQVALADEPTKLFSAYTNNFMAYLGLVVPRAQAVYRVKNITTANPFTDAVAAALIEKIPQVLMQDRSKWRWFMNTKPRLTLQTSRSTVNVATSNQKGVSASGVFASVPTHCEDIEIVVTDSLRKTDRNGLYN
ncbi:MAG: hypothetical protein V4710_06065 [Verrucomicrobiota bacterium]